MTQYAPRQQLKGNIHPVDLIVSSIHFARRKQELAFEGYSKAILNHDMAALQLHHDEMKVQVGRVEGLTEALRYTLAAEAERKGHRVSEGMNEFDTEIERLTRDNPLD